jgi:hypothetical protein
VKLKNGMKAPLSDTIKKILSNDKEAKAFTAKVLSANRSGKPVLVEVGGKQYKFVRATSK